MTTVQQILSFNFSPAAWLQEGKGILSTNIVRLQEGCINKLNNILDQIGESQFSHKADNLIEDIFIKFKSITNETSYTLKSINAFSIRELKDLSYNLHYTQKGYCSILAEPSELSIALNMFNQLWRDRYLLGLIYCYLKNWDSKQSDSLELLGSFLSQKLANYDGNWKYLKSLKSNIKFFDNKNGDISLGYELAIKKKQLKESYKYLSLPESWFSYPYFSQVISAYYEKRKNEIPQFIDDLNNALIQHNSSVTNKRVVSRIIIQANQLEFSVLQEKVKSIAVKLIGDPSNKPRWAAFENASDSEKDSLKKARNILNEWIIKQFISIFFEVCISDRRRKAFWLSKINNISEFKIYGSNIYKYRLERDERISNLIANRYQVTHGTTALMLRINNYILIEFATEGSAFYAYKSANEYAPNFENKYSGGLDQFKSNSSPMLVSRSGRYLYYYCDEGRLFHRDTEIKWEEVFDSWLNKKVLNIV